MNYYLVIGHACDEEVYIDFILKSNSPIQIK